MDYRLRIIERYVRDTISVVENPPFRGDLVPQFHLMELARRAADCHLAVEHGLKALIERAGADFEEEHALLSHLNRLEEAENAENEGKGSVAFLRHCFHQAVDFYERNPNTYNHFRSIEKYFAATGGHKAYEQFRYWIQKQSLDIKELKHFSLELHIEILHAIAALLSGRRETVHDRVEREVGRVLTESLSSVYSRRRVAEEYQGTVDFINSHGSCRQALAEATGRNFDLGDEFAEMTFIQADSVLKYSVDTAVRYFATNSWVLPAPRKTVPIPVYQEHHEGRSASVSTPAGTSLGWVEKLANGRWVVHAGRGYPLVSVLAAKRIDGLRYLVETLTTEALFEIPGERSLHTRVLGSPNELLYEQFQGNDQYAFELWDEEPFLSVGEILTIRFNLDTEVAWTLKGTVREVEPHRVLIEGDALLAHLGCF